MSRIQMAGRPVRLSGMAFGQAAGPPATGKQIRELLDLLVEAGHSDFRDARGPMQFNQRQAGGKFTRDEAQAFIDQLEQAAYEQDDTTPPPPKPKLVEAPAPSARPATTSRSLASVSDVDLLAEVRRRALTVDP